MGGHTVNGEFESLEQRLSHAAEQVRQTVAEVVDAVPVRTKRPAEFQRVLKLDRSLASRILRALRLDDPLAALHQMPGPHGLRLLLRAAGKTTDGHESISRAEKALMALERIVASEIGDWKTLDTALCGWLPEVREQFEMSNRQAAFRAMSNIKGVMGDADLAVTLIHPGTNPDWVDRAGIYGVSRMRRLRAGTPLRLFGGSSIVPTRGTERLSLEGASVRTTHVPPLLREFCSSPAPQFEVRVEGNQFLYELKSDMVGLSSVVDLYLADVMRGRYPAREGISPQPVTPGSVIDIPVKAQIVDVLVHEDVWPGTEPELRMYDTAGRGVANPSDVSRNVDRIDALESIQNMGTDLSRFRTKDVARYLDMIRFVCDKLGWESTRFRGYRCRVDYPVHGTQVNMIFNPSAGERDE